VLTDCSINFNVLSFLTLTLDGIQWIASRPVQLISEKSLFLLVPIGNAEWKLVVSLQAVEKKKSFDSPWKWIMIPYSSTQHTNHYTDWATTRFSVLFAITRIHCTLNVHGSYRHFVAYSYKLIYLLYNVHKHQLIFWTTFSFILL